MKYIAFALLALFATACAPGGQAVECTNLDSPSLTLTTPTGVRAREALKDKIYVVIMENGSASTIDVQMWKRSRCRIVRTPPS